MFWYKKGRFTYEKELIFCDYCNNTPCTYRLCQRKRNQDIKHRASDTTYPETAIHWANNGQVHTYGNYVCMIVLPEGYIIPENVFELE